jgi:outer membrane protein TolC
MRKTLLYVAWLAPLYGQDPLSLRDAVRLALEHNKSIEAAEAARKAAGMRIQQARSGWLPHLNYSESLTRSDNPVFVFGALLTQHQFSEQNFALGPLNQPNPLNNFQSQLNLDQTIYDGGEIRHAVRSSQLIERVSQEDGRRTQQDVIAGVVRAYYGAVLSGETLSAAKEAVRSAEADLKRAEAVRTAGMSTDVDVLSIRVHLAAVTEQQIRRAADLVALDDAMQALAQIHPRKAQVVELRFFGGLTAEEAAEVLKVSPVTVLRDWNTARVWLYREMTRRGDNAPRAMDRNR